MGKKMILIGLEIDGTSYAKKARIPLKNKE
jgi:hypothetical protein